VFFGFLLGEDLLQEGPLRWKLGLADRPRDLSCQPPLYGVPGVAGAPADSADGDPLLVEGVNPCDGGPVGGEPLWQGVLARQPSQAHSLSNRWWLRNTLPQGHNCFVDLRGNQATLVEEAKLVHGGGPDLFECFGVDRRAIGDYLIGVDAHCSQLREELLDVFALDPSVDQLVAYELVATLPSGVHRQEQRQFVLVELIDAQDPGELLNHPSLVVAFEVHPFSVIPAPPSDHRLAGGNPEVPGEPTRHPPHSHPVSVDREDGLLSNSLGVDSIGTKKRRLDTKVARAGWTVVDAHGYEQEHRMVQIDVYGAAGSLPDPPSGLGAPLASDGGQAVADMRDRTGDVVEGGRGWRHGAAPGE
jgi:hypothetical protein